MKRGSVLWTVLLLLLTNVGCKQRPSATHEVWLDTVSDSLFWLHVRQLGNEKSDSMKLPWPVYRLDTGDLTGNGMPEIVIGVTKGSHYWPTPARRLFIYQLIDGYRIRPLWLGSRVGWPLQDFTICHDSIPARIITTELNADSVLLHGQYRHKGFGLTFEKYLSETTFSE